jgi:hypothetical protein
MSAMSEAVQDPLNTSAQEDAQSNGQANGQAKSKSKGHHGKGKSKGQAAAAAEVSHSDAVLELLTRIESQNKAILEKLDLYSSEQRIGDLADTIKQKMIEGILKSRLNISIIPDDIEAQIYELIFGVMQRFMLL